MSLTDKQKRKLIAKIEERVLETLDGTPNDSMQDGYMGCTVTDPIDFLGQFGQLDPFELKYLREAFDSLLAKGFIETGPDNYVGLTEKYFKNRFQGSPDSDMSLTDEQKEDLISKIEERILWFLFGRQNGSISNSNTFIVPKPIGFIHHYLSLDRFESGYLQEAFDSLLAKELIETGPNSYVGLTKKYYEKKFVDSVE